MVANEITPVDVGERRLMLPLHRTLVHWLWLDDEMPVGELTDTVRIVTAERPEYDNPRIILAKLALGK